MGTRDDSFMFFNFPHAEPFDTGGGTPTPPVSLFLHVSVRAAGGAAEGREGRSMEAKSLGYAPGHLRGRLRADGAALLLRGRMGLGGGERCSRYGPPSLNNSPFEGLAWACSPGA